MEESDKHLWFKDVYEGRQKGSIYVASRNKDNQCWRFQVMAKNMCYFVDLDSHYLRSSGIDPDTLKVGQEVVRHKAA